MGALTSAARAEEAASSQAPAVESDPIDRFSIAVPAGWVKAEGQIPGSLGGFTGPNGGRRTVAFFPASAESPNDVNISVVITNVSFEFTKLGSFGSVAAFATNLVNSLDHSFLLRQPAWARKPDEPVQVAKLIDYSDRRDQYQVEYVIKKGNEPQRHLLSTVALGSNGIYNRLYTVTAQCSSEELYKQYEGSLRQALESFTAQVKPLA